MHVPSSHGYCGLCAGPIRGQWRQDRPKWPAIHPPAAMSRVSSIQRSIAGMASKCVRRSSKAPGPAIVPQGVGRRSSATSGIPQTWEVDHPGCVHLERQSVDGSAVALLLQHRLASGDVPKNPAAVIAGSTLQTNQRRRYLTGRGEDQKLLTRTLKSRGTHEVGAHRMEAASRKAACVSLEGEQLLPWGFDREVAGEGKASKLSPREGVRQNGMASRQAEVREQAFHGSWMFAEDPGGRVVGWCGGSNLLATKGWRCNRRRPRPGSPGEGQRTSAPLGATQCPSASQRAPDCSTQRTKKLTAERAHLAGKKGLGENRNHSDTLLEKLLAQMGRGQKCRKLRRGAKGASRRHIRPT